MEFLCREDHGTRAAQDAARVRIVRGTSDRRDRGRSYRPDGPQTEKPRSYPNSFSV